MKRAALIAMIAFLGISTATYAQQKESAWDKKHPRRDQVNDRLANQNRRIKEEVKEGEMSKSKAARLHANDRKIRQEERDMAAQNHGHLTKREQRALNQQENANSRKIGH
ncbi:hypothetical protein [Chitinophaga vietnamensis]|uniref:hypothetical protein n=1 Tax=Chitinophaga vietnamensis TaxID=2593957 RepID=UPI0011787125|nr:hypothetical protein [Chitinophaga vietnamensis]